MDHEVTDLLLAGITAKQFMVFYLVGIIGIVVRFSVNVTQAITTDPNTPNTFKFVYFVRGLIRFVLSLVILAAVIARFQEFSYLLVNIELPVGVEGSVGATVTAGSSFLLGLGIDEVVKRFVKESYKQGGKIVAKIKNNGV